MPARWRSLVGHVCCKHDGMPTFGSADESNRHLYMIALHCDGLALIYHEPHVHLDVDATRTANRVADSNPMRSSLMQDFKVWSKNAD